MSFLPRQRVQAIAARSVWSEVSGATTTSTSSEAGTGLKKCIPTKRAGWASDAASSVTGRELVLVARTVVALTACSAPARTLALRVTFSGNASTTRSACCGSPSTDPAIVPRAGTSWIGSVRTPRTRLGQADGDAFECCGCGFLAALHNGDRGTCGGE
jgi:hypothetical protein